MKYEEYMKKLDNLNEEFEEGLLLELQEKPPTNLHGEIMKSVLKERKRANFLNYRIYAPAIAAVLVFAVVINRPELLEKLNFTKKVNIVQPYDLKSADDTNTSKDSTSDKIDNSAALNNTDVAAKDTETPKTEDNAVENSTKNAPSGSDNAAQNKNAESTTKGNTAPKQGNTSGTKVASEGTIGKTDTLPAEQDPTIEKKDIEESQLSLANLLGMLFFKEPDVNYEIILDDNKSTIVNFITENNVGKLSGSNTYKLSSEQFDSLDKLLTKYNISKKLISEPESTTDKIVKIDLVNYHIQINESEPNFIKFIEDQDKCIKVAENTYKISMENMDALDKILNTAGIKKELINEAENEYVIVKTTILNYEISIDSNQTSIIDFLKDTGKCIPIQDNIYKMNRENFNKFKELLNTAGIELKALNETNSQNILININNI